MLLTKLRLYIVRTLKQMCLAENRAPYTRGPLDFVHLCPTVVMPLKPMRVHASVESRYPSPAYLSDLPGRVRQRPSNSFRYEIIQRYTTTHIWQACSWPGEGVRGSGPPEMLKVTFLICVNPWTCCGGRDKKRLGLGRGGPESRFQIWTPLKVYTQLRA